MPSISRLVVPRLAVCSHSIQPIGELLPRSVCRCPERTVRMSVKVSNSIVAAATGLEYRPHVPAHELEHTVRSRETTSGGTCDISDKRLSSI